MEKKYSESPQTFLGHSPVPATKHPTRTYNLLHSSDDYDGTRIKNTSLHEMDEMDEATASALNGHTVLLHGSNQEIRTPRHGQPFWTTTDWWEAKRFAKKAPFRPGRDGSPQGGSPTINMYVLRRPVEGIVRQRVADTEKPSRYYPDTEYRFRNDHMHARMLEADGWWKPQEERQIMFRDTEALQWIGKVTPQGLTIEGELKGFLYAVNQAPPVSPMKRQPSFA